MPDVQYLGHSCFRLRGRDGVVLTDPFDRSVGFDIGKPTAQISAAQQTNCSAETQSTRAQVRTRRR